MIPLGPRDRDEVEAALWAHLVVRRFEQLVGTDHPIVSHAVWSSARDVFLVVLRATTEREPALLAVQRFLDLEDLVSGAHPSPGALRGPGGGGR